MAIITAQIMAVLLQLFFFELTTQPTRSANYVLFRGSHQPRNKTRSAKTMTDIRCATLATLAEAEGFNLRKDDEADVFGRCQLIHTIIEGCATVDEANYLFYSNFGISEYFLEVELSTNLIVNVNIFCIVLRPLFNSWSDKCGDELLSTTWAHLCQSEFEPS